jgi:cyclopropane fatty-acyl-phospholipid synthase-like methyltransferase
MTLGKTSVREARPNLRDGDLTSLMKYTEEDYYPEDDSSVYEDALCYQPTRQHHLQEIADYLQPSPRDVFVDLGCGKGRMICFMARYRLRKIIGVELRPHTGQRHHNRGGHERREERSNRGNE